MSKITPTQLAVLEAALKTPGHVVDKFPANINGGAKAKVVNALLAAGLAKLRPDNRAVLTPAGIKAVAPQAPAAGAAPEGGTKREALIRMLSDTTDGITLDEMCAATGWQKHTVRGFISGALRRKAGYVVCSQRVEKIMRYRIKPVSGGGASC